MNIFDITESLSLDGMLVITCEKPRVGGWSIGLKLPPRGPMTQATREKIGAGNKGKIRSAETRAKISAANKGHVSDEARAKISAALRGRSVKGEIMTPWGKYDSYGMAKDCLTMLGIKSSNNIIFRGLKTDPENYYHIKEAK